MIIDKTIVQNTAPESPNVFWLDSNEGKLKYSVGGNWEDLSEGAAPDEEGDAENSIVQKGSNAVTFGENSTAFGTSSTNAKDRGITEDSTSEEIIQEWEASDPADQKFALTLGEGSHIEGNNCLALGKNSHAEGNGTIAGNNSSHSEGTGSKAIGTYAHAEGLETIATGSYTHAEGKQSIAEKDASHAECYETKAIPKGSHAEGYKSETSVSGYSSNTLTPKAPSSQSDSWWNGASHAEGNACIAQGLGAHAEGEKTFANERATHTEGRNTTAKSEYSHAEGHMSVAGTGPDDGTVAHAEGESTKATAWASHAEGYQSEANAWIAHSEGAKTLAGTGSQPTAYDDDTDGRFAHAEGNGTWAKGSASHAEGRHTQALKKYDHAEGWGTKANGVAAHAEGEDTQANAECSHAEGWETRTSNDCEHAEGQWNVSNHDTNHDEEVPSGCTIHSVGIGSRDNRMNAFEIMQNGDAYLYGVGGYDGTNPSSATPINQLIGQGGGSTLQITGIFNSNDSEFTCTSGHSVDDVKNALLAGTLMIVDVVVNPGEDDIRYITNDISIIYDGSGWFVYTRTFNDGTIDNWVVQS